jgi:hypothetical protein
VLLSPKTYVFFPDGIRVLVKEKTRGFSFSAGTHVLSRQPKKRVLPCKKTHGFVGAWNSCVLELQNTRVMLVAETHEF